MDPFYNEFSYLVTNEYLPFTHSLQPIGKKKEWGVSPFFLYHKRRTKDEGDIYYYYHRLLLCVKPKEKNLFLVSFLRELWLFFFLLVSFVLLNRPPTTLSHSELWTCHTSLLSEQHQQRVLVDDVGSSTYHTLGEEDRIPKAAGISITMIFSALLFILSIEPHNWSTS